MCGINAKHYHSFTNIVIKLEERRLQSLIGIIRTYWLYHALSSVLCRYPDVFEISIWGHRRRFDFTAAFRVSTTHNMHYFRSMLNKLNNFIIAFDSSKRDYCLSVCFVDVIKAETLMSHKLVSVDSLHCCRCYVHIKSFELWTRQLASLQKCCPLIFSKPDIRIYLFLKRRACK